MQITNNIYSWEESESVWESNPPYTYKAARDINVYNEQFCSHTKVGISHKYRILNCWYCDKHAFIHFLANNIA